MKNAKQVCPLCKQEESAAMVDTCVSAYQYAIKMIKQDHPGWVEKDGACPKCLEYYNKLVK